MENEFGDRPKAMFRYPERLLVGRENYFPVSKVDAIPCSTVAFFDDVGLYLLSRDFKSGESKDFVKWLTIASHKDIVVLMTVQSLRLLDVLVFEPQDIFIMQKWIGLEAIKLEREEYKETLLMGNMMLDEIPEVDRKAFSWCPRVGEFFINGLVSFWSSAYSKPYRDTKVADA
jgi:hypothetical protein